MEIPREIFASLFLYIRVGGGFPLSFLPPFPFFSPPLFFSLFFDSLTRIGGWKYRERCLLLCFLYIRGGGEGHLLLFFLFFSSFFSLPRFLPFFTLFFHPFSFLLHELGGVGILREMLIFFRLYMYSSEGREAFVIPFFPIFFFPSFFSSIFFFPYLFLHIVSHIPFPIFFSLFSQFLSLYMYARELKFGEILFYVCMHMSLFFFPFVSLIRMGWEGGICFVFLLSVHRGESSCRFFFIKNGAMTEAVLFFPYLLVVQFPDPKSNLTSMYVVTMMALECKRIDKVTAAFHAHE